MHDHADARARRTTPFCRRGRPPLARRPVSRPIGPAAASAINCSDARPRTTTWPPTPRPQQVRELFGRRRTLAIGAAFGVIAVFGPKAAGTVEVTTFRRDAAYSDGRHPDSVTFSSAQEDASRRDFTINGLFYDPIDAAGDRLRRRARRPCRPA